MEKTHKMNVNDGKPCTTLEVIEDAWNSFLNSIKSNYQNQEYNLRPPD